jgi:hypothetical protein
MQELLACDTVSAPEDHGEGCVCVCAFVCVCVKVRVGIRVEPVSEVVGRVRSSWWELGDHGSVGVGHATRKAGQRCWSWRSMCILVWKFALIYMGGRRVRYNRAARPPLGGACWRLSSGVGAGGAPCRLDVGRWEALGNGAARVGVYVSLYVSVYVRGVCQSVSCLYKYSVIFRLCSYVWSVCVSVYIWEITFEERTVSLGQSGSQYWQCVWRRSYARKTVI